MTGETSVSDSSANCSSSCRWLSVSFVGTSTKMRQSWSPRERFERALAETRLEKQAEVAAEFDAVHTVQRAREVGSLTEIVDPARMRAFLVRELRDE